ncbi:cell wall-binding repeat-containing protein [Pseudactinotalea sp. HY160]|uniref:cell wall-binding repeat-containing protein n=1 Tax=Pseudactinotalea sp. HY160 TaxID=2654490 RepID=UPI001883D60B|nr:cell wall-binding repeat-containing protein [Pseudactinotalea sp. HY160]
MSKFVRRGLTATAAAAVGALALAGTAFAAPNDNVGGGNVNLDNLSVDSDDPQLYRFAGEDRVQTALDAAKRTTGWGDTVILANSQVFSDALAAAPLADTLDAPILLNSPGTAAVNGDVLAYIKTNFDNVILVGGTDVFGEQLRLSLVAEGLSVDRVAGVNRYQTAVGLATAAYFTMDDNSNVNIFLADGTNFPDALAAGAAAANASGVVLLTKGSAGLDKFTFDAVVDGQWTWEGDTVNTHGSIITVGGPAKTATAQGWNETPIESDFDHAGADRYETAAILADEYFANWNGALDNEQDQGFTNVVLASGENFPDGVVAGGYAANVDGPLLLTRESSLTKVTADLLDQHVYWNIERNGSGVIIDPHGPIQNVFMFGGPEGSLSKNVGQQVQDILWEF